MSGFEEYKAVQRKKLRHCTGSGRVERRKALQEDFESLFHLLKNILNKEDIKL